MGQEKLLVWVDKLTVFLLCALIIVVPISVALREIFFSCLFLIWIFRRTIISNCSCFSLWRFSPVKTELNSPIYIFLIICFLSVLFSVNFPISLRGFFTKLMKWIIVYFITVEVVNDKKKLSVILKVVFFSMMLTVIDGIYQSIWGMDFLRHRYIFGSRISSSFSNPNIFGGWLVVMIGLVFSVACLWKNEGRDLLTGKHKQIKKLIRPVAWILTSLLVICLGLTYSKGAWIASISVLIFVSFFKGKKMLIGITAILLILFFFSPHMVKDRVYSIVHVSEFDRSSLWREALEIVEDYPLLGCGFNTYAVVGPHYKVTGSTGFYPHNCYLHLAAETGILGLGAFCWIMITLFRKSILKLRNINDMFYSILLIGFLAGLFGFLLHSFVDTNIYGFQLSLFMWIVIGLIIAVQKIALEKPEQLPGLQLKTSQ